MIGELNMKPIKKGDTYVITYSFYNDECETDPLDVSTYSFKLQAKDTAATWLSSGSMLYLYLLTIILVKLL